MARHRNGVVSVLIVFLQIEKLQDEKCADKLFLKSITFFFKISKYFLKNK